MTAITAETRAEIESLERKHAENPEGRYFVPLANAYRKAGEVDRAIQILRQGLEKHPEYVSAHIVLGRCYRDAGNLDGARGEFQHVLSLDPQNLVALRTLGELAAANGDVAEARRWYGELLAVDPMNEEARQALEVLGPEQPEAAAEQGGAEAAPVAAADGSTEAATADGGSSPEPVRPARPSHGEERHGFGGSQPEFPVYSGGESVVTETIAELYTRQGFYDRAIEVYKELIRRRGDDPRLRERLERVQQLAAGEAEAPSVHAAKVAAPPPPTTSPEAAAAIASDDPFADSFSEGFPDEIAARRGEARVASPLEVVEEPVTIRSFLQEILSWTPSRSAEGGLPDYIADAGPDVEPPASGADASEFGADAAAAAEVWWADSAAGPLSDVTDLDTDAPAEAAASVGEEAALAGEAVFEAEPWLPSADAPTLADEVPAPPAADSTAASETPLSAGEAPPFEESLFAEGSWTSSAEPTAPAAAQAGDVTASLPDAGSDVQPPPQASDLDTSVAAPVAETTAAAPTSEQPPAVSPIAGIPDDELFPWEIPLEEEEANRSASLPVIDSAPSEPQVSISEQISPPGATDWPDPSAQASVPQAEGFDGSPARPAGGVDNPAEPRSDDDDDLESFQAWLRSLKR